MSKKNGPQIFFEEVNERQGAFHRRAFLMGGFAATGMAALVGRLVQLQILEESRYQLLSAINAALSVGERDRQGAAETAEISARLASLSGREREVLDGLVAGHANKVIAYDLGISPRTVEIYRANVMTKMKAASLSELVRMAMLAERG